MKVLVAAPTYAKKDYAFERFYAAYQAQTWPSRGLFLADNTRDTLSYTLKLRARGVPTIHTPWYPTRSERLLAAWEAIVQYAHDNQFYAVLSFDTDQIMPPDFIKLMVNEYQMHKRWPVQAVEGRGSGMPSYGGGCCLVPTERIYADRYLWQPNMESYFATLTTPVDLCHVEHFLMQDEYHDEGLA